MTIFYPDVSQYTPNVDPAKYPVLIARATLSDRVADPTYATFKQKAEVVGTVFAAYHWLNHGNLQRQAKWCLQHVGPDVPVMIDAEDVAGNTGYAGPLTVDDLLGFTAAYRALGGIASLVYLPFWYWAGPMGAPHRLGELTAAGLHLVSSNYPNAGYTESGPGWAPYYSGAPAPVQWQYTSTPIDMNAFRGTVDEYAQLIGLPRVEAESITLEMPMFLATDTDPNSPTHGQVFLCTDDFKSHYVGTPAAVQDLVNQHLFGARNLGRDNGTQPGVWQAWNGTPGIILTGWKAETHGPIETGPVNLTDAELDALAAKVAALLPAPPTAAEIAAAVNDDAAQRLQS
jgi:hypothetical protein